MNGRIGGALKVCDHCSGYKLRLANIEEAIKLARESTTLRTVQTRAAKDESFGLLLRLAHELNRTREQYNQHQRVHS
jgi:hypothetical protein